MFRKLKSAQVHNSDISGKQYEIKMRSTTKIENLKEDQIDILELKTGEWTEEFSRGLQQQTRPSRVTLKTSFEIDHSEKRMKGNDENLWILWDYVKTVYIPLKSQKEKRERGVENLKEIVAKNFPNLGKDLYIQFMKLIGHP